MNFTHLFPMITAECNLYGFDREKVSEQRMAVLIESGSRIKISLSGREVVSGENQKSTSLKKGKRCVIILRRKRLFRRVAML